MKKSGFNLPPAPDLQHYDNLGPQSFGRPMPKEQSGGSMPLPAGPPTQGPNDLKSYKKAIGK